MLRHFYSFFVVVLFLCLFVCLFFCSFFLGGGGVGGGRVCVGGGESYMYYKYSDQSAVLYQLSNLLSYPSPTVPSTGPDSEEAFYFITCVLY